MLLIKLVARNTTRHRLRAGLTFFGIVIAILAFGLLRTMVSAWYSGADRASNARLITRNSVSLTFPLPVSYQEKIEKVPGVTEVSRANWFAGIYQNERNFFPQFAIGGARYFDLYPEYVLPPQQLKDFLADRKGCIAGARLAARYGWKIGDTIPIQGTIYPGNWQFVLRGIYHGRDETVDEGQFMLHWDYVNEVVKVIMPEQADQVGILIIGIRRPDQAADIARSIDVLFKNSLAATLTETEKAFQLGFIAQTSAIVGAIRIVSFLVIAIIMAVMTNTMAMTARERLSEYATMKALGFSSATLFVAILGESLSLAVAGGACGILLTFPGARLFAQQLSQYLPVFHVETSTIYLQMAATLLIGVSAALAPALRAMRVNITEGLRSIG